MNFRAIALVLFALAALPAEAQNVGHPVCDELITKWKACIDKGPASVRAAMHENLDKMRADWKRIADNPRTKPMLDDVCKEAVEQVRDLMSEEKDCKL